MRSRSVYWIGSNCWHCSNSLYSPLVSARVCKRSGPGSNPTSDDFWDCDSEHNGSLTGYHWTLAKFAGAPVVQWWAHRFANAVLLVRIPLWDCFLGLCIKTISSENIFCNAKKACRVMNPPLMANRSIVLVALTRWRSVVRAFYIGTMIPHGISKHCIAVCVSRRLAGYWEKFSISNHHASVRLHRLW